MKNDFKLGMLKSCATRAAKEFTSDIFSLRMEGVWGKIYESFYVFSCLFAFCFSTSIESLNEPSRCAGLTVTHLINLSLSLHMHLHNFSI